MLRILSLVLALAASAGAAGRGHICALSCEAGGLRVFNCGIELPRPHSTTSWRLLCPAGCGCAIYDEHYRLKRYGQAGTGEGWLYGQSGQP